MGGKSSRDKGFESSLLPQLKALQGEAADSASDNQTRAQAGRSKLDEAIAVIEAGKKESYQGAARLLQDAATQFKLAHMFRCAAQAYMRVADIAMQLKETEQEGEMYGEVTIPTG